MPNSNQKTESSSAVHPFDHLLKKKELKRMRCGRIRQVVERGATLKGIEKRVHGAKSVDGADKKDAAKDTTVTGDSTATTTEAEVAVEATKATVDVKAASDGQ